MVALTVTHLANMDQEIDKQGSFQNLSFSEYLSIRMFEQGLSNMEVAQSMGYSSGNVVSMMKSGNMKVPISRVSDLARKLGADPKFLLEKVLRDSQPELWNAIRTIYASSLICTDKEAKLIRFVRDQLSGFDADLIEYDGMRESLASLLVPIAARERALHDAILALTRRKGH